MRSNLYFIIMIPPITVAASLLGMFIPRAASFLYAVITTYYMLSLYMIIDLMYLLFGGRKALVSYLEEITVAASLLGMFIPRAASFLYAVITTFFTLSNFINIVSMYISTYFGYVLVNAGKDKLKPYHVGLLFNLHDYLLAVPAILKAILDFAVDMEWIGHQKLMPPESMAMCREKAGNRVAAVGPDKKECCASPLRAYVAAGKTWECLSGALREFCRPLL
ncbi:unnamed protein product [Heligmosomoides polygyrus]|uniref:Aa_trans domain-containing protein n=1 Tax=Heligmosomoides polygyrus TaxID=6339 RepID=A0A3P8B8L3_HELPZ|nr:unnamed protein product [Heligmosomoides polygyrus]